MKSQLILEDLKMKNVFNFLFPSPRQQSCFHSESHSEPLQGAWKVRSPSPAISPYKLRGWTVGPVSSTEATKGREFTCHLLDSGFSFGEIHSVWIYSLALSSLFMGCPWGPGPTPCGTVFHPNLEVMGGHKLWGSGRLAQLQEQLGEACRVCVWYSVPHIYHECALSSHLSTKNSPPSFWHTRCSASFSCLDLHVWSTLNRALAITVVPKTSIYHHLEIFFLPLWVRTPVSWISGFLLSWFTPPC